MTNIETKNIIKGFDGNLWIEMNRQKTNKQFGIPLLPKANDILVKYNTEYVDSKRLLPKISNQKVNSYIKEIAEIVGIVKNLTHHMLSSKKKG